MRGPAHSFFIGPTVINNNPYETKQMLDPTVSPEEEEEEEFIRIQRIL